MRRSTILEGVDDKAELVLGILLGNSQDFEHTALHIGVVDTDGAAAELGAVEHEVISVGAYPFEVLLPVGVEPFLVLRLRSGERMVHCVEALVFLAPLEQREVHDPERGEDLRVPQAEAVAHLDTEHAELVLGLALSTAEHEQKVALLRSAGLSHGSELLCGEEFVYAGLDASVGVVLDIYQALGTHLRALYPFGELIELLAGVFGAALDADAAHILGRVEDAEALVPELGAEVVDLHSEADVRLVGAVLVHSLIPAHARERVRDVHAEGVLEHLPHHTLEGLEHVLLLHEAHLAVDLGEFRLAVGPEVLVTEAPYYLEIPVIA